MKNNKLTYFFTRYSMFGIGFFLLFKNAQKDAWISVILGTILGVIVIYIYSLIKKYFQKVKVNNLLNQTLMGKFYLGILLLFYIYITIMILIVLPMFVNSFYLLYTPKIIVIIPFLLIALYLTSKEKRVLETLSNLLCVFSILIIIIYALFLTKYVDFSNLAPIYSTKSTSIIKASLIYAAISSIPQILTINFNNHSFKKDLKDYLLASLTSFTITMFIILTLGEPLIQIYSFPEYALLKQIKILDFIENIENLSTFIWYFDMFIVLSSTLSNIKDTLPSKHNKLYLFSISFIILLLSTFVIGKNYRIIITLFYYYPFTLFIFLLLFITLLIYLKTSSKLKKAP